MEAEAKRAAAFRLPGPLRMKLGWEAALFAGLAMVALGLRLWELDGRTMHYDESLHVHYAWRLATGEGYSHSPWMHGPFQVHLTALIFQLFSDSDFTARLGYALFGAALVGIPYFLRAYLGRTGAIVTAVLLALSPSLLYFSRFGRNEILMVFFAVALLILMWRYLNERKSRYLYMASAVLALAFATKETVYILVAIFGVALFVMALTEIVPWALGRIKLSQMTGAAAFLVLLVTLTLPQWSAAASIPLGAVGLELVNEGVGDVGLPIWRAPFVSFPLADVPLAVDALIIASLVAAPLGFVLFSGRGRRMAKWLLPTGIVVALAYSLVFLPNGVVARDHLISFGVLFAALVVSVIVGLMWRWKVWLVCAGIFYLIWTMLYTSVFGFFVQPHGYCPGEVGGFFGTLCSKFGGIYTGSWQGLGYWLAQHDVARGGQPWYYHFVVGSLYEFVPLILGLVAVVYYLKKVDLFGLMLAFWAVVTLVAYTLAGEKMPWLVVNITVPFILLTGKFVGDNIERIRWRRVLRSASAALLVLGPLLLIASVFLVYRYLDDGRIESWQSWALVAALIVIGGTTATLIKRARPRVGATLAGLSMAVVLLGFSSFVAFRASYSYDDSPAEMLVYAQGSADIPRTVDALNNGLLDGEDRFQAVEADYELWYPLNWYVRHEQREGALQFKCYKDESELGHEPWCSPLEQPPSTRALLLNDFHANRDSKHLDGYAETGPFKNLLWFPESAYRRPGEDRLKEDRGERLRKDFQFIGDTFRDPKRWKDAVDYFLFRRLDSEWWDSKYFTYMAVESVP